MKLTKHIEEKKSKVVGWDLISIASSIGGCLTLMVVLCQPKAPINMVRIPAIAALALVSVVTERLRETDLLSLDKAIEYDNSNKSEAIRQETMLKTEASARAQSETIYQGIPEDEWGNIYDATGIRPPNLEMRRAIANPAPRQPEPAIGATGPVRMAVAAPVAPPIEVDPTGDYDPESDVAIDSEPTFIFAHNVENWFKSLGEGNEWLRSEWTNKPGIGIKVTDGSAEVIYSENNHV